MLANITLVILLIACGHADIIHLPLDQRFTTRVAFLNLATLTPFNIISQPESLLPSLKQSINPENITNWFIETANRQDTAIISLEMYLYGGLIASRISNESEFQIEQRIDKLQVMKEANQQLKIYASAVVMRIPAYDNDFEEPTYWASYGRLIYLYSFFTDKYSKTKDFSDLDKSNVYKSQIPPSILSEFLKRRERNQNILINLVTRLYQSKSKGAPLFQKLYITLDDNAQYGLNIAEADYLKTLVAQYNLADRVLLYPGADEVPLVLLARATVDYFKIAPTIRVTYRNDSTTNLIPNYEGQPLSISVSNQIKAAGAIVAPQGEIALLLNNFNGPTQKQAPNQAGDEVTDFTKFTSAVCSGGNVLGFVDNKYSNGADLAFVDYLLSTTRQCNRSMSQWAYAGWNTNGNTLGSVIANTVILSAVRRYGEGRSLGTTPSSGKYCKYCTCCVRGDYKCGNAYFNLLRILEDRDWQAILRQKMISYIQEVPDENFNHLDQDSEFYQRFALKSFASKAKAIQDSYNLKFSIKQVYFPWNRTFEVGIAAETNYKLTLVS